LVGKKGLRKAGDAHRFHFIARVFGKSGPFLQDQVLASRTGDGEVGPVVDERQNDLIGFAGIFRVQPINELEGMVDDPRHRKSV
jgi:hypothetical protein